METSPSNYPKLPFELDPDERIIRIVHRHWIDLVPSLAVSTVLFALVLFASYEYGLHSADLPIPSGLVFLLLGLILGLAVLFLFVGIFVFRRNILILTNLHLAQVEQIGLFNRRVSQLGLAMVQDVTGTRPGILATVLDFGEVTVQTAGEQEKFIFHHAPHPDQLADECLQTHELCLREQAARGIHPAEG